jgi:hypothetical protein
MPDNADRIDWLEAEAIAGRPCEISWTAEHGICLSWGDAEESVAPTLTEAIDCAMHEQFYGAYADEVPMPPSDDIPI